MSNCTVTQGAATTPLWLEQNEWAGDTRRWGWSDDKGFLALIRTWCFLLVIPETWLEREKVLKMSTGESVYNAGNRNQFRKDLQKSRWERTIYGPMVLQEQGARSGKVLDVIGTKIPVASLQVGCGMSAREKPASTPSWHGTGHFLSYNFLATLLPTVFIQIFLICTEFELSSYIYGTLVIYCTLRFSITDTNVNLVIY